ncbi:winged helix DNA-binding protein [Paenibacillus lautus]
MEMDQCSVSSSERTSRKDQWIQELKQKVSVLQEKFQAEDDEERQWMIQRCDQPEIIELLKEMTVTMLHVVDAVGRLEPVNGITISKQFGIPKGSVSKITKRLVYKEILHMENLPDNKKEIIFTLTPAGREIFKLHGALHKQMDLGISRFLRRYSEDELRFLNRSMQDTIDASWVNFDDGEDSSLNQGSEDQPKTGGVPLSVSGGETEEIERILSMLRKLDSRSLKRAEAILTDVFFTEFDE